MKNYRKTSHTVYDIKYHFVWITKYRKPMLSGSIGTRLRDLIREICKTMDIEIIKGHVSKDHVHLFVSVPPYHSVSQVMKRHQGQNIKAAVERKPNFGQTVLGSSSVGSRIFCRIIWQCHR